MCLTRYAVARPSVRPSVRLSGPVPPERGRQTRMGWGKQTILCHHFRLAPRSMTLDDLELENSLFSILGVNISQTVRSAVARLPLRQL